MQSETPLANLIFLLFVGLPFFIILPAWLYVRILRRAGFNGWWALAMFVPMVNAIALWVFAFVRWPRDRQVAVDDEAQ